MKQIISAIVAVAISIFNVPVLAAERQTELTLSNTVSGYVSALTGDIEIASKTKTPNIYVDAENDYEGVVRVADDLKSDILSVTGITANMVDNASNADIIIGTIGKSSAVENLVSAGKLNVTDIDGEWEAFKICDIDGKVVIAGADKRGTIYGVYDLSEKMGVSPWEWWADVAPSHSDSIYVSLPDGGYVEGSPSVKYRGIFINQEYNLNRWSISLDENGGYMNTATYEKIFELLLRLKANYMWPAMHEYSPAFNNNPENAKKADEYGIVMGTSHCEMLLRNNMGELLDFQERWMAANPGAKLYMYHDGSLDADVAYDYTDVDDKGNPVENKRFIEDYWRERVRENKDYESNFTIGMRGVHDGAWNPVSAKTDEEKIELLEEIITKQREILSEEIGKPADEIPQTFIPYKEIADLYNKGIDIPDDVTIMFTNDNYGHVRQNMNEQERARSGGGGMYYHVSYHGRPSDILWNGSSQLGLIKEEMTKAYDNGADTVWVLNVGPLKPFENQMEYFLDLASDIDKMRNITIRDYVADNAHRYFGFDKEQSFEYADIQCERLELVNARRPEFYQQGLFSLTSYGDEGQKLIDKYAELLKRSEVLYNSLPEEKKDGYYELQHYSIKSAYVIAMNYINADRAILYKEQGRGGSVNKYAALSAAYNGDAVKADIEEYNSIKDGKWEKMIDPFVTKGGLNASWNFEIAAAKSETVSQLPYTEMGIATENLQNINDTPVLEFSGYTKDIRFIDIFNRGTGSFDWRITSDYEWILFNKQSGTVYDDDRIYVGIDWNKAPEGVSEASIKVTRNIGNNDVEEKNVLIKINNDNKDLPEKTYVEANGYVSIEAEHYTNSIEKTVRSSDVSGVVTGDKPRLVTDVDEGVGIIALYNSDKSLDSVQISNDYTDGAYIFEESVFLNNGKTVKGMVWNSFSEMEPVTDIYGVVQDEIQFKWQEQDDLGRSGTSMKFTPDTAASIDEYSAYLEYDVYFENTGTFSIDVYRIPTLNERGSMNFAVGVDENTPVVLKGCNEYYNNSNGTDKWGKGILNNNETLSTNVAVDKPGIHKIRLYGIDTGVIIDKMVITTVTKYESYYGAPESYNTTYNNVPPEMPEPTESSTEIVGDVEGLFSPKLYTVKLSSNESNVNGIDIIKLEDISNANITAAAYDVDGIMLDSETVTYDFSEIQNNEKVTVPIDFKIPNGTSQIQIIVYDGRDTLNALSPSYTEYVSAISTMALYDSGIIKLQSNLSRYSGKEALCLITNDADGKIAYIRQETVLNDTFTSIKTGELNGEYSIKIGVSGDGVVISEKAYTAQNITTDNAEESSTQYSWDFSDESQVAKDGANIPVLGGNAGYDAANKAVKMTTANASGGKLSVKFDKSVKAIQGQKITITSKIAYGRQSGKYMDYKILDSSGKELVSSHISIYSSSSEQSIKIGTAEQIESGLPAGIVTKNKDNDGINNGYSIFEVTLEPDTNTITLNISNDEGSSSFTGSFPEGTTYDMSELLFTTTQTYSSRSCYVDDISVVKTLSPSYTMDFDVKDSENNVISNADVKVIDKVYGTEIAKQNDGTYHLCDGVYSYSVTADGYETVTKELELSQATESKTVKVIMNKAGGAEPTPTPAPTSAPETDYDSRAGEWKFDFGPETTEGYIGVSADKSFTDELDYGFIGIKEDDYKLSSGEYMDGFRIVKGQVTELVNGYGSKESPNNDYVSATDPQNPIRFTMSVENGGYYNVKVTLANTSETDPAEVTLMTERRHQLLTNEEIPAGETIEYEFSVDVETYYWKALNGQYKDDTLSIEVTGTNAAISSMEVTKAEKNGTTIWMITDSTGCDQPTNFPYFNLGSLAGVGQGLTKYLPKDIALSNQGDGGLNSSDTNHYNCVKNIFKAGDYLYVEYGHNETSIEKYTANLEKYYNDCHAAGVKMIVVGPIDRCQTKQFNSENGTWSATLNDYSEAGEAFVQSKITSGADDIAFVDLNKGWIDFLNETTRRVKEVRKSDVYEPDSVYYYYRYKSSGIDTTHINEAGADNAAYIFFKQAKKIVAENKDSQAEVLAPLVNGMREQTPYIVPDDIIKAGKVPNSFYPEIPSEEYEGYEAIIKNVEFLDDELKSVTAEVKHYIGLEEKDIPYALAVAEIYNSDGVLDGKYYSTIETKYDVTNGNGVFSMEFSGGVKVPKEGSYRIYIQGLTNDNTVMEGDDCRISDYCTENSLADKYLIGDKEDIQTPDTFFYYGVKDGADLGGNNGWYLVGSADKSATLQRDGDSGYAYLEKRSESGSYILYRAFDSTISGGKIIMNTDLYYEEGRITFTLSNKTSSPNNGYDRRLNIFLINDGKVLDSEGNELCNINPNEWIHIEYSLDMDRGTQVLNIGEKTYEYLAPGMDSLIPQEVTIYDLEQLNISGSTGSVLSAAVTNLSLRSEANRDLPEFTLALNESTPEEGRVSIYGTDELFVTGEMNSVFNISAVPTDGYMFVGWFDENGKFVSSNSDAQIRLTAKYELDNDPIDYVYKETFTALSTETLEENGWVSPNAQSKLIVKNDLQTWKDGNYIYFDPGSSTRNAKMILPETAKLTERYVFEMDFALVNGSGSASEFTIFTDGSEVPNNSSVSGDYILKLVSTSSSKTMPWTINGDAGNTVILEQETRTPVWAHIKLTVDPQTGEAELKITQDGEERYNGNIQMNVTNGDYSIAGINFKAVKSYSRCQFDNIKIYTASQEI